MGCLISPVVAKVTQVSYQRPFLIFAVFDGQFLVYSLNDFALE